MRFSHITACGPASARRYEFSSCLMTAWPAAGSLLAYSARLSTARPMATIFHQCDLSVRTTLHDAVAKLMSAHARAIPAP
ncbi:hypothetical protein Franean1_0216 [Parafrankia sp. EAN1pec]|nr:hypothetical protein Franean1_0216 [Frankia sp. EAN1pec]